MLGPPSEFEIPLSFASLMRVLLFVVMNIMTSARIFSRESPHDDLVTRGYLLLDPELRVRDPTPTS